MATKFDIYREYEKLAPIFFASTGLDPFYLEKWNPKYPLDMDASCKKLAALLLKIKEHSVEDDLAEDALNLMQTFSLQIVNWMQWASMEGSAEADKWLMINHEFVMSILPDSLIISENPPFNLSIWEELAESLDGRRGLMFDLDSELKDNGIMSNPYLYRNWYFLFEVLHPVGLRAYFLVKTEDEQDDQLIIDKIKEYLVKKKKNLKLRSMNKVAGIEGKTLALDITHLDVLDIDTYDKTIERALWFVNNVEKAIQTIDFEALNEIQQMPYVHLKPTGKEQIVITTDWGHDLVNREYWREGAFVIQSDSKLRKAALAGEDLIIPYSEIVDEELAECYMEEWDFPDNELGEKARKMYDEGLYLEAIEENLGQEYQSRNVTVKWEYLIKLLGFAAQ